jgi:starch-binding outer membrane protein, SusD/RagB family
MKTQNFIKVLFILSSISLVLSCTDLSERNLDGPNDKEKIDATSLLKTAYRDLRAFQAQGQMFAMNEMSSDALVGPTRGGDWDDNGLWRQIHQHEWTSDHAEVRNAYNSLLGMVNDCNKVIENGTASQIVEARFLKAFAYYNVIDLFGQAPYRPIGSSSVDDALVYNRSEGTAFIISELEAILPSLPARVSGEAFNANQDAARFLLAKTYLNKGVFTATNVAGPYTFAAADMTKVVQYVNDMTNSLETDYWSNFAPNNNTSNEIVFSSENKIGDSGDIRSRWHMGTHYNQNPSGWNGFTTLGEYYDRYNPADLRINNPKPSVLENNGYNLGFLVGQMKNAKNRDEKGRSKDPVTEVAYTNIAAGTLNLQDRAGNPLVFTKELTIRPSGAVLETAGIRGMKYEPDNSDLVKPNNDYVLMRYSDALLMKAEAILRGGSGTAPDMSAYFARTGQAAVTLDLPGIYIERGRELWWEGWRRNDMIRFGKFLDAKSLKTNVSNVKYLLYPMPTAALYNPNIKQNPGY